MVGIHGHLVCIVVISHFIFIDQDEIRSISQTDSNFILLDENKMGDHDYPDEMAQGTDHLNSKGAAKLTHRLDSLIQTLDINWK